MKREEYEERMKDSKYKELEVTNADGDKDYVFISYRGSSWKKVLTEIVYKLQKEYGLRVYFDKEFASETNIWIKQFIYNMDAGHCKAVLCFFDEGYVTSYATLLELMHAMNPRSGKKDYIFPISFPIEWEQLNGEDADTGLGVKDQNNPGWKEEKEAFDYEFKLIQKEYSDVEAHYYKGAVLRGRDCKNIMAILQPKNKREYVNDEAFYNQFIVEPLKKKCPTVFEEIKKDMKPLPAGKDADHQELEAPTQEIAEYKDVIVNGDSKNSNPTPIDGYKYKIFGVEYEAGRREQGKLMFDAFEALVKRYPGCAGQLTQRTSVARAEDVKNAGTKEADPTYFRGCKSFNVDGKQYLVGTSYGYEAKIAEIKGMFKICEGNSDGFEMISEPEKSTRNENKTGKKTLKDEGLA